MKLKKVTITGADDNTSIDTMLAISKKYPFVEWGILFSPTRQGTSRYPSIANWLHELKKVSIPNGMSLSAHLCGEYTRKMTQNASMAQIQISLGPYLEMFSRMQLNFNSKHLDITENKFLALLHDESDRNFILQHNHNNAGICQLAMEKLSNVHFLFDASGGLGKIPGGYFSPLNTTHLFGYAGGLTPENLESELNKINIVVGNDLNTWIDAETGVRTNDMLDMSKVESFLNTASKFV
jgi:phosphoribosylanthranilate isomerase